MHENVPVNSRMLISRDLVSYLSPRLVVPWWPMSIYAYVIVQYASEMKEPSYYNYFTGYGSTAPQTTAGKAAVVLYGFFGCSGNQLYI